MAHKTERKTIMKSVGNNNLIMTICASLIFFLSTPSVFAQSSGNAALLYYQAFLLYEKPDETMSKMLSDFRNGKIKANEVIEQHIEKNKKVVDFIVKAANIPNCDWGYDYSQGFELVMPNLAHLRRITYLIQAEAKLLAEKGDYQTALERCLSMHKMALHAADRTIIGYLVAIAISGRANSAIQNILKDTPDNPELLNSLKENYIAIDDKFPSLKDIIVQEGQICAATMRKEKIQSLFKATPDEVTSDPKIVERILSADEDFFKRNRDYWFKSIDTFKAAMESALPYQQTYAKLIELQKKIEKEVNDNPDATLASISLNSLEKIYTLEVRRKTQVNAIKAAIEIYLIKAKTGKLPDALPAGLPGDLFSGKPFEYKKTSDGFILRCQGEELSDKDKKIHEYEFKVKK
jgi:hypothetical protein